MTVEYRFIEPTDVLYLRGNRLFGESGSHGAALMPPWPSLVAGALRSAMLVTHGVSLPTRPDDTTGVLADCLGTPAEPGSFRITGFTLARRRADGDVEPLLPLPQDLVGRLEAGKLILETLRPARLHAGLACSAPMTEVPLLAVANPAKPESGLWLTSRGLGSYLVGEPVHPGQGICRRDDLWSTDSRLGIALDGTKRTAAEGRIYTTETVALGEGVGFLVGVDGAAGYLPGEGLIRLGGDGRGAGVCTVSPRFPVPAWEHIARERRFRLVLTTPGLFPEGWLPPGVRSDDHHWEGPDFSARLVSAVVGRCETISGWDLVRRQPKPAQRVAPVGSVYWFEDFRGEVEALQRLMAQGLWDLGSPVEAARFRRAEGFNNFLIAGWPQ